MTYNIYEFDDKKRRDYSETYYNRRIKFQIC